MLCSRCYKKIPEGEEVAKTTGYFKVNGWGRWGAEIYCKRCALWQDKKDRSFLAIFFIFPFIMLLGFVIFFAWKGNFPLYTLLWLIPTMVMSAWFVWFEFFSARKTKKKKKKTVSRIQILSYNFHEFLCFFSQQGKNYINLSINGEK